MGPLLHALKLGVYGCELGLTKLGLGLGGLETKGLGPELDYIDFLSLSFNINKQKDKMT